MGVEGGGRAETSDTLSLEEDKGGCKKISGTGLLGFSSSSPNGSEETNGSEEINGSEEAIGEVGALGKLDEGEISGDTKTLAKGEAEGETGEIIGETIGSTGVMTGEVMSSTCKLDLSPSISLLSPL